MSRVNTRDIEAAIIEAARPGLEEMGRAIQERAGRLAPMRTGALRASGQWRVERGSASVIVAFTEPYAAAMERGYAEVPDHRRKAHTRRNRVNLGTHRVQAHRVRSHRTPKSGNYRPRVGQIGFLSSALKQLAPSSQRVIGESVRANLRVRERSS